MGTLAIIQGNEIWVIGIVLIVLFGGSQLPKLAKNLGQAQKELRKGMTDGIDDDSSDDAV